MASSPPSTSAIPPAIRNLLLDLLAKADLASVTPRNLREGLESIQNAQKVAAPADESRHIPASFNFDANKKQVNKIIREVFDQVATGAPPAAGGLPTDSTPSSQSTPAPATSHQSPPPPKTTIPAGGGLALPGLGGIRGSHASPPPAHANGSSKNTDGDAALAAKLQAQQNAKASPATRTSSTPSSSKKRKVKADPDEIDSGEDSDVETAAASSAASKSRSRSTKKTKKDSEKKSRAANPNNPFNKPVLLSPAMAEICGSDELPRHGVVKQLWAYVKARDLQNPNNKRQIMCDEKLQELFGKPMVDSFEMSKLIGSHLKKKEDVVS